VRIESVGGAVELRFISGFQAHSWRRRVQWQRCGVDVGNVAAYSDSFAVIFVWLSPNPQFFLYSLRNCF